MLLRNVESGGAGPVIALRQATDWLSAPHKNGSFLLFFPSIITPLIKAAAVGGIFVQCGCPEIAAARAALGIQKHARDAQARRCSDAVDCQAADSTRVRQDRPVAHAPVWDYAPQLAMVPVLMSHQAKRHNEIQRQVLSVEQVLASRAVGSVTNQFECARLTNGGGCVYRRRALGSSLMPQRCRRGPFASSARRRLMGRDTGPSAFKRAISLAAALPRNKPTPRRVVLLLFALPHSARLG